MKLLKDIKAFWITNMTELKTLYSGKYLNMVERNGWEYITRNHRDVAIILPVIDNNNIILIDEFRQPLQKRIIGLPAGLVGDKDENEGIFDAARRELLEETGYLANQLEIVIKDSPSSSGMTDETFNLLIARKLKRIHRGGGEESEDIKVLIVDRHNIDGFLEAKKSDGFFIDPKIYMGMYFLGC